MTWSRHSRRVEPIGRSTKAFCQTTHGRGVCGGLVNGRPAIRHGGRRSGEPLRRPAYQAQPRVSYGRQSSGRPYPSKERPCEFPGSSRVWVLRRSRPSCSSPASRATGDETDGPLGVGGTLTELAPRGGTRARQTISRGRGRCAGGRAGGTRPRAGRTSSRSAGRRPVAAAPAGPRNRAGRATAPGCAARRGRAPTRSP
jgi:hypothetical protein